MNDYERRYINQMLEKCSGNVSEAAKRLGIHRSVLYKKIKELGLKPLVKIVSMSAAGVDPRVMGLGPVPAINKLLNKTGLKLDDEPSDYYKPTI
ncbi:hypothetical protein FACS1894127_3140 [Clostridia bacterium]|nr:hypothetical protein FACS1894127_3140 [Clostridia bacterium]